MLEAAGQICYHVGVPGKVRLAGKRYDSLLGEYKRTHGQDQ